jgi:hypothetical protein
MMYTSDNVLTPKALQEVRSQSGGQILGRNWGKSFKSFPPCYSQSLLIRILLPTPLVKSGLKLICYVNIVLYKETSSLRTLMIMPRNLNEIVLS